MDVENPIFCLEHCKGNRMFVLKIPDHCSYCGVDITDCALRVPPFRLPTPFRDAKNCPCSIVLKPTKGDFLTDYKNADFLHIGITSSEGIVYEFDADGLNCDRTSSWKRCVAIRDFNRGKDLTSWGQYWDFTISVVSAQDTWLKTRYDEDRNNCFSFVLAFLRALQTPEISSFARDRRLFCEKFILPKTAFAAKYILMYRRLIKSNNNNSDISLTENAKPEIH